MSRTQVIYTTGDVEYFNDAEVGYITSSLDDNGEKTTYIKITSEGYIHDQDGLYKRN